MSQKCQYRKWCNFIRSFRRQRQKASGDIVRQSVFATLRLMTNLNLGGCSTGRFAVSMRFCRGPPLNSQRCVSDLGCSGSSARRRGECKRGRLSHHQELGDCDADGNCGRLGSKETVPAFLNLFMGTSGTAGIQLSFDKAASGVASSLRRYLESTNSYLPSCFGGSDNAQAFRVRIENPLSIRCLARCGWGKRLLLNLRDVEHQAISNVLR